MRGHELCRRLGIAMLLEALGEHIFLLGLEQRKFLDLCQIAIEACLAAERRNGRRNIGAGCHDRNPFLLIPIAALRHGIDYLYVKLGEQFLHVCRHFAIER
jgi:hypothetical protein